MATSWHVGIQSQTGKQFSMGAKGSALGMGQQPDAHPSVSTVAGLNGAFSQNGPGVPQITNGMWQGYENLAKSIDAVSAAYGRLSSVASTEIPWDKYGTAVEGVTNKFTNFGSVLLNVSNQLEAFKKNTELLTLLDKIGRVSAVVTRNGGIPAQEANRSRETLFGPGDIIKARTTEGWEAQRLTGVGAASHPAMQEFKAVQTQIMRTFESGISTIDPRILRDRQRQLPGLTGALNRIYDTMETARPGQRAISAEERAFLTAQLPWLTNDLTKTSARLTGRELTNTRSTGMNQTLGAFSSLMDDFRTNRNMGTLREAGDWQARATRQLETEKDEMTRAEYIRYRSRINVYGSQLDQLRTEGKIDPRMAIRKVGSSLSTLNSGMKGYREGSLSLGEVQERYATSQALMDQYGPWMENDDKFMQLSDGLRSHGTQLAALSGPRQRDLVGAAAKMQRGFRFYGSVNQNQLGSLKTDLTGQMKLQEAVLEDGKASDAAKGDAKSQLAQMTTAMNSLNSISKATEKSLGGVYSKIAGVAGMAVGIYSISHAFSRAVSQAIEFSTSLKKVDAALRRLPNKGDRAEMASAIKDGAIDDALTYGVDLSTAAQVRTTAMMGANGSVADRSRLGKTISQLGMIGHDGGQEYTAMVAPLSNAGMDASQINRFFQTSQILQGSAGLSPERMRVMMNAVASGSGGLNALTDFETLQAVAFQEAASTKDRAMGGSKLNRMQTSLRSGKTLERLGKILSRGGERGEVGGFGIEEITNNGSPMLTLDRLSKLYKTGDISDSEVSAIAQTIDKRSAPSVMNMLKTGLDDWRGKVREADAQAASGFVSTDEQASAAAKGMGASVARINAALGALAVSGLDPISKSLRTFADMITSLVKTLGPIINGAVGIFSTFAVGMGAMKGFNNARAGVGNWVDNMRAAGIREGDTEAGAGSFFRGLKKGGASSLLSGGMIGLAAGVGMTAWSAYSDWREKKDAELVKDPNESARLATIESSRTQYGNQQALELVRQMQELKDKGLATTDKQRDMEDRITKALGDRKKAHELVQLAMKGETAELEKQLGLMNTRDAGTRAGKATALVATAAWGGKMDDARVGRGAVELAQLAGDPTSAMPDELRAVMNEQERKRTVEMDDRGHSRITYVPTGRTIGEAIRKDGYVPGSSASESLGRFFQGQQRSAYFNKLVGAYGGKLPEGTKDEQVESALAGNSAGLINTQWNSSIYAATQAKTPQDKLAHVLGLITQVRAGAVSLETAGTGIGSSVRNDPKLLAKLIGKGGGLNRDEIFSEFAGVFGAKANISGIAYKGDDTDSIQTVAMRVANGGGFHWEEIEKKYGKAGVKAIEKVLAMRFVESANPSDTKGLHEGGTGPKVTHLGQLWTETFGQHHRASQIPDAGMMRETERTFAGGLFRYGNESLSSQEVYDRDVASQNLHYNHALGQNPMDKSITADHKIKLQKLLEEKKVRDATIRHMPSIFRRNVFAYNNKVAADNMFGVEDELAFDYGHMLSSDDPYIAKQGKLLYDAKFLRRDFEEHTTKEALLGMNDTDRKHMGARYNAKRVALMASAHKGVTAARESSADFEVFSQELANPLGLYAGEGKQRDRMSGIISKQIDIQEKLLEEMGNEYATLEDKVKITKQVVELEKKKVELDEGVIRARRAVGVGKEAQSQTVDALFNFSKEGTANRLSNLRNIGTGLVQRGLTDNIKDALGKGDNPLAKMASFIYDPSGSQDAKYAQDRLTQATQHLAGRIKELTDQLRARVGTAKDALSKVDKETSGFTVSEVVAPGEGASAGDPSSAISGAGYWLSPKFLGGGAGSRVVSSADLVSGNPSKREDAPSVAIANQNPGVQAPTINLPGAMATGNGKALAAHFNDDEAGTTARLTALGLKPQNGSEFTAKELQDRAPEIQAAQLAAQDKARRNPISGIFGGASFSQSFWTQPTKFDATGKALNGGGGRTADGKGVMGSSVSNTGAAVGGATVLMAGASAYYSNQGHGQAAQNYAAGGAMAGAAGSILAMGAINGWNPVGWALLAVGAIMTIMSSVSAGKHDAEEKNKQYEEKLADFNRQIAIQEEQKKAIGLMAERVLSMRGDVSNSFEGVAASSFFSGRWAGRAPSIQVDKLTVVANNPAELSAALTTALTTQVRQGL